MADVKMSNIPSLHINRIMEILSRTYCAYINGGHPLNRMPAVMLWGPPGIGKSQAVQQLAETIRRETGKRVPPVIDVRLSQFTPVEIRGIPTSNEDRTETVWLRPHIFKMDPSEDCINILFLDELSSAAQSIQTAAYQITEDRAVGEHKLPDNCIIIAAGNRTTDKAVAYKMSKALSNRMMHFEVANNFNGWKEWAIGTGINPKIIGFLTFRQSHLMRFDPASEDVAFATPRSWEKVSDQLNIVSDDLDLMYPVIGGLVGVGEAVEFTTWAHVYNDLPDVEDIFNGKNPKMPRGSDAMYALTSAMTAYARSHKDDLTRIANSLVYANRMPPDFSAMLMKDYMSIEPGYRTTLMQIPEFMRWVSTKGRLINGII